MRAGQPFTELMRRVGRRRAVKRHKGRRNARDTDDAGAPAIRGNVGDLDQIVAAGDGLFEVMD